MSILVDSQTKLVVSGITGREGTWSTSRKLRERLFKELEANVSLRVEETDDGPRFHLTAAGRAEVDHG